MTGTTSATVIQSMPSMKLVRLTNQTPPISSSARSSHHGSSGRMRISAGNVASTTATAAACSTSRGSAASGRTSSVTPTRASPSTAASAPASGRGSSNRPGNSKSAPAVTSVMAAITAMPPPCGVGLRVGGARVGARQRVAREQGMQHHDQRGADERRRRGHREMDRPGLECPGHWSFHAPLSGADDSMARYNFTISAPTRLAANSRSTRARPAAANFSRKAAIARQALHRVGQRRRIVDRHQKRIEPRARDLAAARHVGRHDGAAAGGGFQQA